MVAHGLITGALFLITGSVFARGDTYEIDHFGGLASRAPLMTSAILVGSFASLGLPGLAGFVDEFQIFVGTFAVEPVLAAFGLLAILITAAFYLRLGQGAFFVALPVVWGRLPELGRDVWG